MFSVRNKAAYWVLLLCLCFASTCSAIGFGDLKVYSYLDEPLVAEIQLTNYAGMDTNLLQVNLAGEQDFVRAGIDRPYILNYLLFQTFIYNDKLMILVRTSRPVKTPFLEFLVEISWPEGNLIKDYTILLDPPPANMSVETRPKSLSQQAEEAAKNEVNVEDAIQQQINLQKAAQQKHEAESNLKNVVRLAPNSFADETFDQSIEKPKPTPLVPSEVPEVLAEEEAQKAKLAAAKHTAAERTEYQKQLQSYETKQQQSAKAKAQAVTPLSELITELDLIDNNLSAINVDQIVAAQNAYDEQRIAAAENNANAAAVAAAAATPITKPSEEAVDFSHPLAPATPISNVPPNATGTVAVATPPHPAYKIPSGVPMVGTTPASSGNHLYLGIILSLLLIAVGVAIAVKRGVLRNIMLRRSQAALENSEAEIMAAAEVPVTEASEQKTFEAAAEEFNSEENEEIELATAPPAATIPDNTAVAIVATTPSTDDLNKFEKDFEKMDLKQLAPEAPPAAVASDTQQAIAAMAAFNFTAPAAAASDLLNETTTQPTPVIPTSTLKLAPDGAAITPPTMEPTPASLKHDPAVKTAAGVAATLAPASGSIIDNAEAVQLKLDLARKYLETGDRESAKTLLQEIIEIANDAQTIEAQVLLSGIQ